MNALQLSDPSDCTICGRDSCEGHLPTRRPRDYRDFVIEAFADSEAELRETVAALIELVADLTVENHTLRQLAKQQLCERIQSDIVLDKQGAQNGRLRDEIRTLLRKEAA